MEIKGGKEFLFSARISNVRHLATLIKSIHFKDQATCRIAPTGITFTVEDSRCVLARGLINTHHFVDYKFISPVLEEEFQQRLAAELNIPEQQKEDEAGRFDGETVQQQQQRLLLQQQQRLLLQQQQQAHERMLRLLPPQTDLDGGVVFGINLATLLHCLNIFGNASSGGIQSASSVLSGSSKGDGYGGGGGRRGDDFLSMDGRMGNSTGVTAMKIGYRGLGSRLELILEDGGVITTCSLSTSDPEPRVEFDFTEGSHLPKVIMKSEWLLEALTDLDATSETIVFRLSPSKPRFRISSQGTVESLDVDYSEEEILEAFQYEYDGPIEMSYRFGQVLYMIRALQVSQKVVVLIDDKDFMKTQFLLPAADHKFMFAEYCFAPFFTE